MKVKLARTAGFCMGVRRAVNRTLDAARNKPGPITTLGPLIHNPQVVEMLAKRGVGSSPEPPGSGTVVIRSHGVAPGVRKGIKQSGLSIFDATCPRVARVHGIVGSRHRKGFTIVVLGDRGHAEVDGIVGCAGGDAHVIQGMEDVGALPDSEKVCFVSQTTQERERFEAVAEAIRRRYDTLGPEALHIVDTICDSTRERQDEVRQLARTVEAIVVVGGKDSANTGRLVEVAVEEGVPAFLAETAKDLDRDVMARFGVVGLTAGASTPNWMIRQIYEELQALETRRGFSGRIRGSVKWMIMSNVYVALGAGGMTFAAAKMQGFHPWLREAAISMLFIFAVHTLTLLADARALELNVPQRARSFARHREKWIAASLAAAAVALGAAFTMGARSGLTLSLLAIISFLYPVQLLGAGARSLPGRALLDVPAGRDLFMAFGWAALVVLLPLAHDPGRSSGFAASAVALVTVVGLVFVRALLRDFRDIQADRLIGRETLPVAIGVARTRKILFACLAFAALTVVTSTVLEATPTPLGYAMLIPLVYAATCVPLFTRKAIIQGFGAELVIDAVFILAGIVATAV